MGKVKRTDTPAPASAALVFTNSSTGEPFTTSDVIAEHTGNGYRPIQRCVGDLVFSIVVGLAAGCVSYLL